MLYEVTCSMDGIESHYELDVARPYDARVQGLAQFLEDNKIPGSVSTYMGKGRHLVKVSIRSLGNRRSILKPRPVLTREFLVERTDSLRKWIRESDLPEPVKSECLGHLVRVKGALSGQEFSPV